MQAAQPVLKSFLAPLYRLSISKTDFIRLLLKNPEGGGVTVLSVGRILLPFLLFPCSNVNPSSNPTNACGSWFFLCYFKKLSECLNTSWQTQIKNIDMWLNSSSSTNESRERNDSHICLSLPFLRLIKKQIGTDCTHKRVGSMELPPCHWK